jgi:hypothetical protein
LLILDKTREKYSALCDRIAELQKMTTQFEQIGVSLPEALCVCNEVFKEELAKVTTELSNFASVTIGPIPKDPDSGCRSLTLPDKIYLFLAMCIAWGGFIHKVWYDLNGLRPTA